MAIPNDQLSSLPVTDHWYWPDSLQTFNLLDYELGGINLNDTTQGRDYQRWTLRYYPDSDDMVISSDSTGPVVLFNRPDITEISLAFDQNMDPFVAFVQAGQGWFWWYDTDIPGTTFTPLPANALTPRCCMDDKRQTQDGTSDIILGYVLDNGGQNDFAFRVQRDRYTVEYLPTYGQDLRHPVFNTKGVLKKIGMNKKNRLQLLLQDPTINEVCR